MGTFVRYGTVCSKCQIVGYGNDRHVQVYRSEGPGSDDMPDKWEILKSQPYCAPCAAKQRVEQAHPKTNETNNDGKKTISKRQ